MTALPSLEKPAVGTCCPRCAEPLELEGFCGACQWQAPIGDPGARARLHSCERCADHYGPGGEERP